MTLAGLAGLPCIGEFACNGIEYNSNLLSGLIFLFLQRLTIVSLLSVPLSPSIFYSIPSYVSVMIPILMLLASSRSCSYWIIVRPLYKLG